METAKGWCYFMAGGEMYRTNGTKSELCEDIELREVPEEKAAPDRVKSNKQQENYELSNLTYAPRNRLAGALRGIFNIW